MSSKEINSDTAMDINEAELKALSEAPTFWQILKKEFKADKLATTCLILLIIIFAVVLIGSVVLDQGEVMRINLRNKYMPPGEEFILGTDIGGRSIAGQLFIGGRNSILIGFAVTVLTSLLGIIVGLIVGFYGGMVDNIIMRICDFIQVLPSTMLIITFVVVIPSYTMWHFIFIMSFLGFGLPPSTPSLGTLVSYARTPGAMSDKLWLWLPASLLILVMMLCINYVGQAVRRASDAKQRLG